MFRYIKYKIIVCSLGIDPFIIMEHYEIFFLIPVNIL